jgi:uncharacterized YccA/Bax inhibitor family protein
MALTHSSNPALNDTRMQKAANQFDSGWAAPTAGATALGQRTGGPADPLTTHATMTLGGVLTAAAVLLVLLLATATYGWFQVDQTTALTPLTGQQENTTAFPMWLWGVGLAAMVLGIVTAFKATWARVTAPIYALGIGGFVGAISAVYNTTFNGIVLQAVLLTAGVFCFTLFLYATRIIRVTRKLAMGIVAAVGTVFIVYLGSFIWGWISGTTPLIYDAGPLGIGISVVIVGVAAFSLLLDFDFIERGVEQGLPKGMEWYAAFGLVVTLVWLYLEILRLLAKLRQ